MPGWTHPQLSSASPAELCGCLTKLTANLPAAALPVWLFAAAAPQLAHSPAPAAANQLPVTQLCSPPPANFQSEPGNNNDNQNNPLDDGKRQTHLNILASPGNHLGKQLGVVCVIHGIVMRTLTTSIPRQWRWLRCLLENSDTVTQIICLLKIELIIKLTS